MKKTNHRDAKNEKGVQKKIVTDRRQETRPGRLLLSCAVILALTLAVVLIIHNLPYQPYSTGMTGASTDYEIGKVIKITEESLEASTHQADILVGKQTLEVKMLTGEHKGETLTVSNFLSTYNSVVAKAGQKLVVIVDSLDSGEFQARVYNYYRTPVIYFMGLVFLAALALVGRLKGVMSGLGLIYTFVCVLLVFLPLVVRGFSPVWAAIMLVVMVTTAAMIFINGLSKKSFCAVLGTTSGVVLSGVILFLFNTAMHITGINMEEAESLMLISQTTGLVVKDLLFAGILVASLGAIMDVAMSIVSAMYEIHNNMPRLSIPELFRMGINVGSDMIGTMSNTLILAFAGTSLNMMILLYSYSIQYNQLMNMNRIGIEMAQALAGSLAIILTVPLTAAVTSRMLKHKQE